MTLPTKAAALTIMVAALTACGQQDPEPAAPTPDVTCAKEHGMKLGVPFVRVCAPSRDDAVWVAAAPLPCSAGEHETMTCPFATPLMVSPESPTMAARRVMVTDAVSAHRTCAMRFGGRLPTPDERRELRRTQGLAAVVASALEGGVVRLDELDEWTAVGACDNPSAPGPDCRYERFPGGSAADFSWASMLRCDAAAATRGDEATTALGGSCAPNAPCVVQSPWMSSASAESRAHRLDCAAPPAAPEHPAARADVAAFRCILPRAALTPE